MEQGQQYVGIDLHRRRSVIVRRDQDGETLSCVRVDNDDLAAFSAELAAAGEHPEVVLEATYGWYWLADFLADHGVAVHLAHPLGNNWGHRRVKNDRRDAEDLADLYRIGRLAEAWAAPPPVRELRELVRYRGKLVALRAGLKAQIHGVLAKEGVQVGYADLFGRSGRLFLAKVPIASAYRHRVDSLLGLIDAYGREISALDDEVAGELSAKAGYETVKQIAGIGDVLAAVFVAEIGDVTRFKSAHHLASWAGLTPQHRESDNTVHRGPVTKQGSRLVRWAAVEAAQRQAASTKLRQDFLRISESHGASVGARRIARVAVARKIVTLVYFALRDGELRSLAAAT